MHTAYTCTARVFNPGGEAANTIHVFNFYCRNERALCAVVVAWRAIDQMEHPARKYTQTRARIARTRSPADAIRRKTTAEK